MAQPKDSPGGGTDPKDIAQHLRTIHFSLLAACIALYALITAGRSDELKVALQQLDRIEAVVAKWNEAWLDVAARAIVADESPRSAGDDNADGLAPPPAFTTDGVTFRVLQDWTMLPLPPAILRLGGHGDDLDPLDPKGPLWSSFRAVKPLDLQFLQPEQTVFDPNVVPLAIPAPRTLNEMETLWNTLEDTEIVLHRADGLIDIVMGPTPGAIGDLHGRTGFTDLDITVGLRLEPIVDETKKAIWRDRIEHEFAAEYHLVGHVDLLEIERAAPGRNAPPGALDILSPLVLGRGAVEPARLEIISPVKAIRFNAHDAFVDSYDLPDFGSFAQTFPELSANAAGKDGLYLDKARAALESEARRSEKQISLFGVSIPSAMVAVWGVPLVMVAQFYFLLHLRSLHRTLQKGRGARLVPWIGVYPDPLARITTVLSAMVLPPAALLFVVSSTEDDPDFYFLPLIALSGLIGTATFLVFRRVWARLAAA